MVEVKVCDKCRKELTIKTGEHSVFIDSERFDFCRICFQPLKDFFDSRYKKGG